MSKQRIPFDPKIAEVVRAISLFIRKVKEDGSYEGCFDDYSTIRVCLGLLKNEYKETNTLDFVLDLSERLEVAIENIPMDFL